MNFYILYIDSKIVLNTLARVARPLLLVYKISS
jgi:hypothetical protein